MAHNIEQFQDGTSAFFSARVAAWHKLGTITEGALTADEALKIAHLDWQVHKSDTPVGIMVPDWKETDKDNRTLPIRLNDKFLTYRYHPKTHKPQALGVVGSRYTPVQNSEAFAFLNLVSDESGAVFETAGALGAGEQVFMTMKLPEAIQIGGQDAIEMNLLAWNTHDGSSSFKMVVTPIRVVCQNTLSMALAGAHNTFALRHTSGVTGKVAQARETLGLTFKYAEAFEKEAELLIAQSMTDKQFEKLIEQLLPKPVAKAGEEKRDRSDEARQAIKALWSAPTQENIKNTKWAAYNTVAEYVDWASPVREGKNANARALRTIQNKKQTLKSKTLLLLK